jgi:cell division septation protein DedD
LELENLLSEESKQGAEESEQPEKILPSESLKFMTSLKSEQPEGILSEADRKPVTVSVAPSAEQPKQEKQKKVDIQPPQEPQFDYVLRVAAFKTPEQAQKLLEKLQKVGIKVRRTQVKTNRTTWYYVQALLRGATSDLRELRRQLAAQGLKDAMVVSEKAVPARKK